jgi:phage tail sheath gpL-like
MAASQTYSNLLAHGIDDAGTVPAVFELFAGDTPPVATDQGQAADAQALQQFQVVMHNAVGRVLPLSLTGDYAAGSIAVGGQPANTNTVTVNGHAITFISAGTPTATQVLIGATTADTAQSLRDVINSDPDLYGVTAGGTGTTVSLTALAQGTAGNSITLAEAVTDAGFTVSGATLTGANAAEDVPSGNAIAITAQAVTAATPGNYVPLYVAGCFNHEALVWPAGLDTLRARKMAFEGTGIVVKQLL